MTLIELAGHFLWIFWEDVLITKPLCFVGGEFSER